MRILGFIGMAALAVPVFCADWNPQLAAKYLDQRQQDWFAWPAAKAVNGPCLSCHTGVTYLLARPGLRKALGESQPTSYETGLRNALRARAASDNPCGHVPGVRKESVAGPQGLGVETVLAALFLAPGKESMSLDPDARLAFDRLWSHQIQEGPAKGAWQWFSLKLDPYEMPASPFYGATFAAMAIGSTPAAYRNEPRLREHIAELNEYFAREWESQPLHNRLMLLWASTKLPGALPAGARKATIDATLRQQNDDGGWSIQALGPWVEHPGAPESIGSNGYATALATFVLTTAGLPRSEPKIQKAVKWLESHQDRRPDPGPPSR